MRRAFLRAILQAVVDQAFRVRDLVARHGRELRRGEGHQARSVSQGPGNRFRPFQSLRRALFESVIARAPQKRKREPGIPSPSWNPLIGPAAFEWVPAGT